MSILMSITDNEIEFMEYLISRLGLLEGYDLREREYLISLRTKVNAAKDKAVIVKQKRKKQ